MRKLRLLLGVCVLLALGVAGSSAFASPPGSATCSGGAIASGTYNGLTVTGSCGFVPGAVITVNGNLVIHGWTGGWIGVIRVHVGGNLIFDHNRSVINGLVTPPVPGVVDSDSSEIMTNVVGGNLICIGNTPAAQVNPDDGGQPN